MCGFYIARVNFQISEISSNTIMNVYISILTLGLKYMKILEISSNTTMNLYISIVTLGLKYMKILGISKKFQRNFGEILEKFQGNVIKHNNECIHIHPNPRPEIYENFRNFREILSNTIMNVYISILTLGLKYMKILEISLKVLKLSHLRISGAWVYMYMIIVLIDYFLKFR